ncbi:MAG: tetratricopeptide repeat protein [Acidobacteriia bacterium]|nr:tetratricopeptide repeat protein [Terriglobia bacterium]
MSLPLKSLVFATVLIFCLTLAYFTVRNYTIETLLDRAPTKSNLLDLDRIAPNNPFVSAALGRLYQYSAEDYDLQQAIAHYQRASAANPYDSGTWQNLAKAYEASGLVGEAARALQNATAAAPSSTAVHWSMANFLVRNASDPTLLTAGLMSSDAPIDNAPTTNRVDRSKETMEGSTKFEIPARLNGILLEELRRTIDLDSNSLTGALSLASHAGIDPRITYRTVVPANAPEQFAAINWFAAMKEWDTATLGWDSLSNSGNPFDIQQTLPYIDALISNDRIFEANATWSRALSLTHYLEATLYRTALDPIGSGSYSRSTGNTPDLSHSTQNLIFNPTFSREPLNGGFDWRIFDTREAPVRIDKQTFLKNRRSLRIEFTGSSNLDFAHVYQYVPVRPSTPYDFSVWLKTQGINTDHGLYFEIIDIHLASRTPQSAAVLFQTTQLLGDNEWTELNQQFTTGPSTHLLVVRLRRSPSPKFDNLIKGRVWIGNVMLVER